MRAGVDRAQETRRPQPEETSDENDERTRGIRGERNCNAQDEEQKQSDPKQNDDGENAALGSLFLGEDEKPNLNCGSVYHVMNSTCIHYEALRPIYIHQYMKGNIHITPYNT